MNKFKQLYKIELSISEDQLEELLKHDLWLTKEQAQKYGFIKN